MSNHRNTNSKKRVVQAWSETFLEFTQYLLNMMVSLYMLLILVVLPFYNEEGYSHIGTDKSTFFRQTAIHCSRIILPIVVVLLGIKLFIYWKEHKGKKWLATLGVDLLAYFKKEFSITDYFALSYGCSIVIAYLGSNYKEDALWGVAGWFMGLLPQLALVISYFLIAKCWRRREWLIFLALPVSAIVFCLGYLNRFNIYPIDMKIQNVQFISTIGNINWYCGYLMCIFFGGFFLLWQLEWKRRWMKWLLMGYVAIGYATLVTQGSSSGILTMAVMFLATFFLSARDGRRMEAFWELMVLFSGVCTFTFLLRKTKLLEITYIETTTELFTNQIIPIILLGVSLGFWLWVKYCNQKGRYPQKLFQMLKNIICGGVIVVFVLFVLLLIINTVTNGSIAQMLGREQIGFLTFTPDWGSNRGATWTAGVMCFMEQNLLHKLIGAGPDCMSGFLYQEGSDALVALVKERFGTATLTNAHNEWLTILVNMGVLGFVSYVGMMTTAIKRYISSRASHLIAGACGFCLLAYTINNMFSFQQSMSASTIFIVLAVGESYMRQKREKRA